MDRKISRRAMIGARRVDSHRLHASLFYKKFRQLPRNSRKVKISDVPLFIGAEVTFAITPVSSPTGARQNDGTDHYSAVNFFPTCHVLDLYPVIVVLFGLIADIDHDPRSHRAGKRHLIGG